MKYFFSLLFLTMISSCNTDKKYNLIIFSVYKNGDTTSKQEKITAKNDSVAFGKALSKFLIIRDVDKKYNVGSQANSWKLLNTKNEDIQELLPEQTLINIKTKADESHKYVEKRLKELGSQSSSSNDFMTQVRENQNILKASVTAAGYLCLAVMNDGTKKNAMAIYYCRLAKEAGRSDIKAVKILDAMHCTFEPDAAYGTELGRAYCN